MVEIKKLNIKNELGKHIEFNPETTFNAVIDPEHNNKNLADTLKEKQSILVSGLNICTINGNSLLGNADIKTVGKKSDIDSTAEIFNDYVNNSALGKYSHSEGNNTTTKGIAAHSEGINTSASGNASHAEGYYTNVETKFGGHTEGQYTKVTNSYGHAEGDATLAAGNASHAEGEGFRDENNNVTNYTTAQGVASHAEGKVTFALGRYSHSEGEGTTAQGIGSHAQGCNTMAIGDYSFTSGLGTEAHENSSISFGVGTKCNTYAGLAVGKWNYNGNSTDYIFSIGIGSEDYKRRNAFIVKDTGDIYVKGIGGYNGIIESDSIPIATILNNLTDNLVGIPFIQQETKKGEIFNDYKNNKAPGSHSHAEGNNNNAIGLSSHVEGFNNVIDGCNSHGEGSNNITKGNASHAEGFYNTAEGDFSHAEGFYNIAYNKAEHASGIYNMSHKLTSFADIFLQNNTSTINSIGIGTSDTERKNAFEVLNNGNIYVYGLFGYDGTNPNSENNLQNLNSRLDNIKKNLVGRTYIKDENTLGEIFNDYKNNISLNKFAHAEGNSTIAVGSGSHSEGDSLDGKADIKTDFQFSIVDENKFKLTHDSALSFEFQFGEVLMFMYGNKYIFGPVTITDKYVLTPNTSIIYTIAPGINLFDMYGPTPWPTEDYPNPDSIEIIEKVISAAGSHAEGGATRAAGVYSHAEGVRTTAGADISHAEGMESVAVGTASHAEGKLTKAIGNYSHAAGFKTIAKNFGQTVIGRYNLSEKETSSDTYNPNHTLFTIGNGEDENSRSNALEINGDGDLWVKGICGYNGKNANSNNTLLLKFNDIYSTIQHFAWPMTNGIFNISDFNNHNANCIRNYIYLNKNTEDTLYFNINQDWIQKIPLGQSMTIRCIADNVSLLFENTNLFKIATGPNHVSVQVGVKSAWLIQTRNDPRLGEIKITHVSDGSIPNVPIFIVEIFNTIMLQ